mgnify:CR=1 FL=1
MKRMTIYDIAKNLGVSPSTISKVLNETGNVSLETRKKILEYIKSVDYVPQASARMLKSKRTYTIGIVFTEESSVGLEHSFFSSILQHFKTEIEKEGYELSFIVTQLGKHKLSYREWCINKRVDGVYIVVGNYEDKGLYELIDSNIPCISNDMIVPNLTTVISDNEQAMDIIMSYIKNDLKITKVGYLSGPSKSKAFAARTQYFLEHHREHGLEIKPEWMGETLGYGVNSYAKTMEMFDKNNLPEVLIVGSDDISLGTIKAFKKMGLRIPEDIQIIGFDDVAFAQHFEVPLTTIRQDRERLGKTAAQTLIEMIENNRIKDTKVIKIPVELIERETTIKK